MEILRTPDERFAQLPGFAHEPRYRDWEGMRLAHVDVGEGEPVVLLHGEPTWSFLWREVIDELAGAGHRCVAPDLPGFGRSDKPDELEWYTYDRHTDAVVALLEELDLRDVTLVVHDWGGPIGLRVATTSEVTDRVARIVAMDTGVLTGEQDMGPEWHRFRDHVVANPDLDVGRIVTGGCHTPPAPEVMAAYDAPFPSAEYKAGPRSFPPLIPLEPDAPGAAEGRAVAAALAQDERPALLLWADSDTIIPLETVGRAMAGLFPTAGEPTVIEEAGHFLQEDQGRRVGEAIVGWLGARR